MDQLRKIFGWLKRQHFWVLSIVVALVALGCWWRAAGTLSKEFTTNQTTIVQQFTTLAGLKNQQFHPNDTINERQVAETKKQSEDVEKIWQQLYDRQREDVLEWPSALSQRFRDTVEKLNFGDPITPPSLLGDYQNYAQRYFPELPKIVGARPLSEEELNAAGGFGGGYGRGGSVEGYGRGGSGYGRGEAMMLGANGLPEEMNDSYVCEWLDQAYVRQLLDFPTRPSSIRVWVTQEDLWVYKTLLTVIANTNKAAGATRKSNAAVKVIYSLEVGKRAAPYSRTPGRVYRVPTAAPAAEGMLGGAEGGMATEGASRYGYGGTGEGMESRGGYGYESGLGGMEGRYGAGTEGPMTEAQERDMLTGGRYLGPDGKPVGGGADMAMVDPAADPAAAAAPAAPLDLGVEYKRLPVRMQLQMDQRWLTHLITECANQPLQVEVQEVRINPSDFAGASGGGFQAFGGGGYGRGEGGYGGGGAASLFPERTGIQTFSAQPNLVNVVVQGTIYIFNPPDPSVLQAGGETQVADASSVQ
jgi:hypothetical protein